MTATTTPAAPTVPVFGWGDRLRRVRRDMDMDQAQFGRAIGLSKGAIGQHEMRDDLPQSAGLIAHAVSGVFGIDYHWLVTGCDEARTGTHSECITAPNGVTRRSSRITCELPRITVLTRRHLNHHPTSRDMSDMSVCAITRRSPTVESDHHRHRARRVDNGRTASCSTPRPRTRYATICAHSR